ncbi:hypothetical protein [Mesorhizobium sp.]|uniref:hypothetical protein n=1 Tax=Mesorhizobium sp. TaxID=1871066 RepID=UPI0025EAFF71|nr:hypothetical protein [Mesorhizobium sp.]
MKLVSPISLLCGGRLPVASMTLGHEEAPGNAVGETWDKSPREALKGEEDLRHASLQDFWDDE